jgi:serine/threonine protein kinase
MSKPDPLEQAISAAARHLPPELRTGYLDGACGRDSDLRRRVETVLDTVCEPPGPKSTVELDFGQDASRVTPTIGKAGDRIDRYKLLEQIGEGGCGVVYMAEQEEPVRRRVALKVIKLGMDTRQVIARFEAERQALALMDHANIAKVLDAGTTAAGRPFFVMELVRGVRITDYCDRHNLSTRQRLELFVQVCHAIQHAHQKGIIHRDIKPSNILVTVDEDVPRPKVIDFGIAKATTGQRLTDMTLHTAFEQFIGTPAYMSPEQAEMSGLDIDTRSDIYALGVLLYELLTGRTPFDARRLLEAALDELRRVIREEEPPRPSTRLSRLGPDEQTTVAKRRDSLPPKLINLVRGDLDWIVMKCLEKDRTRRYETANALATDVERHLNNEPVLARPPTFRYRFTKLIRRNKLAFASTSAVSLALLIGAALYYQERLTHQRAMAAEAAALQSREEARAASLNAARLRQQALEDARKNQHAEDLVRQLMINIKNYSSDDPAKETYVVALAFHHVADLLRMRNALGEARLIADESVEMFRRHSDWPASEEMHALEVLASVLIDSKDFVGLADFYPRALVAAQDLENAEDPAAVAALRRLARLYFDSGYYAEARALYLEAAKCYTKCADAGDLRALNGLAWLLATCGDKEVRDGQRAVRLGERAVAFTERKDPKPLDTLAAAYAEVGRFAAAVGAQREAITLAKNEIDRQGFELRLRFYEAKQPFHE